MKSVLMPRLAAPLVVLASVAFLPTEAHASFVFADPTGFSANYPAILFPNPAETPASSYNFLGTGDLGLAVGFQGGGIRFTTTTVDFSTAGTSNPSWMGGVQQMFRLSYWGFETGEPYELAQLDFTFATPLSAQSYMVFTDFDSDEGLAIAAYDTANNLVAFSDFTFAREDGEEPNGSTSTSPSWTNTNPTAGWGGGDNTGWTAASAVSGYLQDLGIGTSSEQAVTLQANTDISRVSFYYNAETNPTGPNSLKFNFASPDPGSGGSGASNQVPGPLPVLGIFTAFGFSRKLRQRIQRV